MEWLNLFTLVATVALAPNTAINIDLNLGAGPLS